VGRVLRSLDGAQNTGASIVAPTEREDGHCCLPNCSLSPNLRDVRHAQQCSASRRRATTKLLLASRDEDGLATDPARILGGEEDGDRADIVGLADAAERGLRFNRFLEVAAGDPRGVETFGLDHAGIQRVDADLSRAEFFRIPPLSATSSTVARRKFPLTRRQCRHCFP